MPPGTEAGRAAAEARPGPSQGLGFRVQGLGLLQHQGLGFSRLMLHLQGTGLVGLCFTFRVLLISVGEAS